MGKTVREPVAYRSDRALIRPSDLLILKPAFTLLASLASLASMASLASLASLASKPCAALRDSPRVSDDDRDITTPRRPHHKDTLIEA